MAQDKKKKIRLDKQGQLRVPPVAIAYFFDRTRRLTFVFPVPGEHPDITIRRGCKMRGIPATAGHVTVTKTYWEIVRNLPSAMITGKGEDVNGAKISIFSIESMRDLNATEEAEEKNNSKE